MKILKYYYLAFLTAGILYSCDSMLDIATPTDSLSADATYSTIEGIKAAEVGLYTGSYHNNVIYYQVVDIYYAMFSDDMNYRLTNMADYYQNTYTPTTTYFSTIWQQLYKNVYQANDFITHISGNALLTENEQRQLIGQALFFRAYDYFLLVNSFGDVPLVLSNNYNETAMLPRAPKEEVYDQIVSDLTTSAEYLNGAPLPKTRITAEASLALLARTYLYREQWQQAKETANRLIPTDDGGSGSKFKLESADRVFLSGSTETIMHANLEGFTGTGTYIGYTRNGALMIPTTSVVNYRLSEELVNCLREDSTDLRNNWVGVLSNGSQTVYYPYKYKNNMTPSSPELYENYIFLRLAEQYLIRAEAEAHLGNLKSAIADINTIRMRANLEPLAENLDNNAILLALETERRKEFFDEQGHRWFDLNRTGRTDAVLSKINWKKWSTEKSLLPIPQTEIGTNPNLTQNPGYNR